MLEPSLQGKLRKCVENQLKLEQFVCVRALFRETLNCFRNQLKLRKCVENQLKLEQFVCVRALFTGKVEEVC